MKLSEISYVLDMHTAIDDGQRKILSNLYLRKSAQIWLILSWIADVITLSIAFFLLFTTKSRSILFTIIVIVIAALTVMINLVAGRYHYALMVNISELTRYYGVFPEKLVSFVKENFDTLLSGKCLSSDYRQITMEYLNKKCEKRL